MYSETLYNNILNKNDYFKNSCEDRYADFESVDPFPRINEALLNSEDILKYVLTVGMIEDFNVNYLSGATYSCEFSGKYYYWDTYNLKRTGVLENNEPLNLRPNSITYLEVKQKFRMPKYLVLRFNLQVPHVYKGLLLGTGPIVDPNFVGHLYIPLHNLTSNEYIIKKDATLISVEFTKLSKNPAWELKDDSKQNKIVRALDFSEICYGEKKIKPDRTFTEYAEKALIEDNLFRKEGDSICISSSIPEAVVKSKEIEKRVNKEIETFHDKWKDIENKIDADMKEGKEEIDKKIKEAKAGERFMRHFSIIAAMTMLITAISLGITANDYFKNANDLKRATKQMEQYQDNQEIIDNLTEQLLGLQSELTIEKSKNNEFKEKTDALEKQIDELIRQIKELQNGGSGGG